MKIQPSALLVACALPFLAAPTTTSAQTLADGIVACPTQNALEQSIGSEGAIIADDCTRLQIDQLTSDSGELCLIDFGMDEGFLGELREVAFPTQWWVECDDLTGATR